jgi:hypothetical protein
MVEVSGRRDELLQGLVDRTKMGLQSVLRPSTSRTRIFNGLSSRIESALSKRSSSSDLQTPASEHQPSDKKLDIFFFGKICNYCFGVDDSFYEEPDKEIKVNSPNGSIVACGADPYERLTYKIGNRESYEVTHEGDLNVVCQCLLICSGCTQQRL